MQCNYNSFILIINFHGLFRNARRCRKSGACQILVPLRYIDTLYIWMNYMFNGLALERLYCVLYLQDGACDVTPMASIPVVNLCNFVLLLSFTVRMLREELQLLQEQGSHVGEVVKAMDKKKVLVKVSMEPVGSISKPTQAQLPW